MADVFSAIRTQDGWNSMTPEQQARYTYHFELLSSWAAAIPANLVAEDESWIAEVYDDWPGGLNDTTRITIRTTSETNYIAVVGVEPGAAIIDDTAAYFAIRHDSAFSRTEHLGLSSFRSNAATSGITIFADNTLYGCVLEYIGIGLNVAGTVISTNSTRSGLLFNRSHKWESGLKLIHEGRLYNNLCHNNTVYGIEVTTIRADAEVINCICFGNTTLDFEMGAFAGVASNNASQDGTALGAGSITGFDPSVEFVDAANGDYHLADGSQFIGAGLNLIEAGLLTSPQYDLDGNQWPDTGPWDLGPYMYDGDTEPPEPTDDLIRINGQAPDDIIINGQSVDAIRCNGEQLWP